MTVVEMKNRLHQQIDNSDEKLLKIIYAVVNEYGTEDDIEESRKRLIQAEREQYLAGAGRSYSWDEVKNMAIKGTRP